MRIVKLLDRYVFLSVVGAFCFGVGMFMALVLAVGPLQELMKMIAMQNVPIGPALSIFLYQLPGVVGLTFPMSVLLAILLTFSRMSSDSEMVAIRAAGVSFLRIMLPTLLFAALVTVFTFYLSDRIGPQCTERASLLEDQVLSKLQSSNAVQILNTDKSTGNLNYTFVARNFDAEQRVMRDFDLMVYRNNKPYVEVNADEAHWDAETGRWTLTNPHGHLEEASELNIEMTAGTGLSKLEIDRYMGQVGENPFVLTMSMIRPEDMTGDRLRAYVADLQRLGRSIQVVNNAAIELYHRKSTPFACIMLALIAAPLGLRHHRTSSAVGVGISLLVILAYIFVFAAMSVVGQSGAVPLWLAAWLPNILGTAVGIALVWRANS